MLKVKLNEIESIAILEPDGKLSESDFKTAAETIDPYIEKVGKLNGIIIQIESFPRWDSFSALVTHLKFVREHHKQISYVAFVTNSVVGKLAEHIASHFVSAKVKKMQSKLIKFFLRITHRILVPVEVKSLKNEVRIYAI